MGRGGSTSVRCVRPSRQFGVYLNHLQGFLDPCTRSLGHGKKLAISLLQSKSRVIREHSMLYGRVDGQESTQIGAHVRIKFIVCFLP